MPPGRKLPGKAGRARKARHEEGLAAVGDRLRDDMLAQMNQQMAEFTRELEKFARDHERDIQSNPTFRAKFHEMCNKLGVDPLTTRRGVWGKMMPGMGDFYYILGTRIIEVCLSTRRMNGGILGLDELLRALRRRKDQQELGVEDVERAVKTLATLESGFEIVNAGAVRLVRSVPVELNEDHTMVLNVCRKEGFTTVEEIRKVLGWDERRARATVGFLLEKELAWVDVHRGVTKYWVLGLLDGSSK